MKTRLLFILMLLASSGINPQPSTRAASPRTVQAPVLKWQHGGCYSSWCETGWYSSPAAADLDGDGAIKVIGAAYTLFVLNGEDGSLKWSVDPPVSGARVWPDIAVAEDSGYAYLLWHEGYYVHVGDIYSFRYRTWHAYWDGAAWSAPQREINDQDTAYSSIAATADGQVMLAWFQRWNQSSGGGVGPGDPIVPRTAYGVTPGSYGLRQAVHDLYPEPERDESIMMAYSPGDDAFVIACDHFMWPGHSRVYRYLWKDGTWSEPVSVAENFTGWASPVYVGAAADTALIRYVYNDNWGLEMRTETGGVLGTPQAVADYLGAEYTGVPSAYFTDRVGNLHLALVGDKDGVPGFYYVSP